MRGSHPREQRYFYGTLNAEQKARFNAIGRSLAQNDQ
jgi:hypothetical protein